MKAVKSLLPTLCIAALIALFYGRGLLPGRLLMPLDIVTTLWPPWQMPQTVADVHNGLISDIVTIIYPAKLFASEHIRAGYLPLWNPFTAAGYPMTYDTQAGIYHPLSILMYLRPLHQAWNAMLVVQMLLGGWFMSLYLRQLGLQRAAIVLGSILFLFNGMMIVWLEWHVIHAAVIWLPLQLWGVERIFAYWEGRGGGGVEPQLTPEGRPNRLAPTVVVTGVTIGLPWLNGHWNWTIYCAMTLGLYILWRGVLAGDRQRWKAMIGAVAIGIGLSLVQLLPSVIYLAQSHRGAYSWAQSAERGLLKHIIVLFIPDFFGSPVMQNWWGTVDVLNFNEVSLYLGIVPLFLIVHAVAARHHSHWRFFALWGLIGLLWTLGTVAYRPMHALPIFSGFFPSRAIVIVVFCGSVLAAMGLDALQTTDRRYLPTTTLFAALSVAVVSYFFWQHRAVVFPLQTYHIVGIATFAILLVGGLLLCQLKNRQLLGVLAIVIVAADLYQFGHDYNSVSSVDQLYPSTEIGRFLQAEQEPYRVVSLASGTVYQPNTSLVDGIENVSGYQPGLQSRLINYVDLAEGGSTVRFERVVMPENGIDSPLLDALNVKYVLSIDDLQLGESRTVTLPEAVAWGDTPQSTPIALPDAGLHRVTLPVRGNGSATVRVLSADATYEFAHASADVNGEEIINFDFGAFPSEWGREFLLVVEAESGVQVGIDAANQPAAVLSYLPRRPVAYESGKTRIYENAGYLPRAFVVHEVLNAADENEALQLLTENQSRIDAVAIVEGARTEIVTAPTDTPSTVRWQMREPNRLALTVEMAVDGFLVVSEIYYPGWRVTVDGESAELIRTNSVMRGVPLSAGTHEIEMVFRPLDFQIGTAISLATLLISFGILWKQRL